MINLLPAIHKQEIRAARANVILVRYIVIMLGAILVLAGLLVGAFVVLNSTRDGAQVKVTQNEQRVTNYSDIRSQADSFRADLATAKTILNNGANFSKLIYRVAAIIPQNVVLDSLALDPASFGSPTTLSAEAKTFADVTKLKNALIKNSDIFSNVQLQTVTTESATGDSAYPVKVTLNITFNKEALR